MQVEGGTGMRVYLNPDDRAFRKPQSGCFSVEKTRADAVVKTKQESSSSRLCAHFAHNQEFNKLISRSVYKVSVIPCATRGSNRGARRAGAPLGSGAARPLETGAARLLGLGEAGGETVVVIKGASRGYGRDVASG